MGTGLGLPGEHDMSPEDQKTLLLELLGNPELMDQVLQRRSEAGDTTSEQTQWRPGSGWAGMPDQQA